MNLDILIKLCKLANNNPNENEANAAARKVCKMIEENKYQLSSGNPIVDRMNKVTQDKKDTYTRPTSNWTNTDFGGMSADEILELLRRATREAPYTRPTGAYGYGNNKGQSAGQNKKEEPKYKGAHYDYTYYDDDNNDIKSNYARTEPKQSATKRILTCSKCNQKKTTKFVGLASEFVCNDCEWKKYSKEKV